MDVVKGKTCSKVAAEKKGDENAKSSSATTVKEQSMKKSEDKFDTKDRKDKACTEGTPGNEAKEKTVGKEITEETAGEKPKELTSGNEPTEQTHKKEGKKEASKIDGKSTDILGKSPEQKRKSSDSCNSSCSSDCSACNRMGSSSSSGSSTPPRKKKKFAIQDDSDEFSSNPQEEDMGLDEEETGSKKKQQITPPMMPLQRPGVISPTKSNIKKLQSPKSKEVRIQEYMQSIGSSGVKSHISSTTEQKDSPLLDKKCQLDTEDEEHQESVEQSSSKGKKMKSDGPSDKGKKKQKSQKSSKSDADSVHTDVNEECTDEKVDESNTPPNGYDKIDDEEFEKIFKGLFQSYQRLCYSFSEHVACCISTFITHIVLNRS